MRPAQRRSQSRNRRVSNVRQRRQQHLLDVKVRSRRAAQHRARKALAVLSRVVLLAALCAAVYAGTREAARRLFFENPDYQLKTIELQTDGTLQREQILNAADLREGENIFRINLARVHDLIQQLPQTDEVQVVRKLPSEIDIRVVERKPVAWITNEKEISDPFASDSAFLVDGRGVLMKEKKLLLERMAGGGQSRRIARSKDGARAAAVEFVQLFANALSNPRDRRFPELSPAGDRQKS
jgi:POTRA domain, FtsQ-type